MKAISYQFRVIAQDCHQWQWERALPAIECAVGPVRGQGPLALLRPVLAGPVEVMGLC